MCRDAICIFHTERVFSSMFYKGKFNNILFPPLATHEEFLLLPNSSHAIFNARVSSLGERAAGGVDVALFVSNSPTRERLYSYRESRTRPSATHTCRAAQSKCPEGKASCRDGYTSMGLPYPDPSLHLLPPLLAHRGNQYLNSRVNRTRKRL